MVFSSYVFVFVFLPAVLVAYYLAPRKLKTPPADAVQLRLLRLGESRVRVPHAVQHGRGLPLRPDRGSEGCRARGSAGRLGDVHRHEPGAPRLLQVRQLRYRQLQRAGDGARRRPPAMGDVFPDHAAARHQFLHVPVDELHHRRLPTPCRAGPQSRRLRLLRRTLPATGRRTHRPLPGNRGSTRRAWPQRRQVRPGRFVLRVRDGEEDPHRQSVRKDRGRLLRSRFADGGRCLVRDRRLLVPDLLRLQRLQRHGHRLGADARVRVSEELRLALSFAVDHRVLATLAPVAVVVPAGLPLHTARGQPQGGAPHLRQPDDGDAASAACGTARCGTSSSGAASTA